MKMEMLQFTQDKGWSLNPFPTMDSENTLVLVFASPEFRNNPEPIQELAKHYPKSVIIGCSGAGEIAGSSIIDKSLSVALIQFEETNIRGIRLEIKDATESFKSGEIIAKKMKEDNLRGIFVLSEGLNVNGSELVKGLNAVCAKDVVVTGGLAGDGANFKHTWSIYQGKIYDNTIVAVGFYGDKINIGHASQGGWNIFGPERRVTRSTNNILYELDGKPALTLYKEYLGERAEGLPATGLLFPLAIRQNKTSTNQLVRTILAIDEKAQSLTFAGDIPVGHLAQLMRSNFDYLIASAGDAAEMIHHKMTPKNQNKPILCIAVSCVGRRILLGERTEEEVYSVVDVLPAGSLVAGFYSYGELSPYETGDCMLHNQTMTLTSFHEN